MKLIGNVKITKGWETWKKSADEGIPEMEAAGGRFIFSGCSMDESTVYAVLEVDDMEKFKAYMSNPEVNQKRLDAGVLVETTEMIPLKD